METRIKAHTEGQIDAVEQRLKAYTHQEFEKVETKLLTEFHKWGRTSGFAPAGHSTLPIWKKTARRRRSRFRD
jgi:hypothetical protein